MKWQIYGVWVSLLVSLVGLGLIVWKIEPQTASLQIKALFFIAIFILVWSAATAIIFSVKNLPMRHRASAKSVYDSVFYDSFLAGLFVSIVLGIIILIKKVI